MKRLALILLLVLTCSCTFHSMCPRRTDHAPALALSYSAAILNTAGNPICGATFIDANRVITAAHCVDPGHHMLKSDDNVCLGKVVKIDETLDLAILETACLKERMMFAGIAPAPQPGTPVWAVGSPFYEVNLLIHGYVSKVSGKAVIVNLDVYGGFSGGGVFNEYGQLVGMITHKAAAGPGIGWAVPGQVIWRYVNG